LISVRSEVQVFPGPPYAMLPGGLPRGGLVWRHAARVVLQGGAIAQLGERVLCKHDVVGSIPSGSTIGFVLREGAGRRGAWQDWDGESRLAKNAANESY
jgi:hypothetical protein